MRYVAGLLFDDAGAFVALIEKQRPAWQAGRWNAIGGKVEPGEAPEIAMTREFLEETGVHVADWRHFATLSGEGFSVLFYTYRSSAALASVYTMEDEIVATWPVENLPNVIPNIRWLTAMALHSPHDWPLRIEERAA